jgi:excisionase family DNA binding protein
MIDRSGTAADAHFPPLLTVKETAAMLRLSVRSVRRMIADQRLPVVRFGRAIRIRSSTVAALIEGE